MHHKEFWESYEQEAMQLVSFFHHSTMTTHAVELFLKVDFMENPQ